LSRRAVRGVTTAAVVAQAAVVVARVAVLRAAAEAAVRVVAAVLPEPAADARPAGEVVNRC
jgi:hypothetical protein